MGFSLKPLRRLFWKCFGCIVINTKDHTDIMSNEEEISEKFKQLRVDRVNSWKPKLRKEQYDFLFPIEEALLDRIDSKLSASGKRFFTPLSYAYDLDTDYHVYISYFIDSLDCLPLKVDLSSDVSWKGLELYVGKAYESDNETAIENVTQLLRYAVDNYLTTTIESNPTISSQISVLMQTMPSQSYEFLAKRLYEDFSLEAPRRNKLYKRIALDSGTEIETIDSLYRDIYNKYGEIDSGDKSRKVGRLLYKLLQGETINLPSRVNATEEVEHRLGLSEKLNFIVNGLLYTFRNERFHGNTFSPFKSSKATLMTYSHAHYMFLWSYFLVNISKLHINTLNLSVEQVVSNMETNIESFVALYGRHLSR